MIPRDAVVQTVLRLLKRHPTVAILGARQVGKTTLARTVAAQRRGAFLHLDLESPEDLARLQDPMLALKRLKGLVVIHAGDSTFPLAEKIRAVAMADLSTAIAPLG